jgi:hypothetical protein
MRAQLAAGDGLQTGAVRQGDDILATVAHRIGDDGFVDAFAHDQDRHSRRALLLDLHERGEIHAQLLDEGDQHLRIDLRKGVPQVAGVRQPRAMDGVPGLAERTIDRLDVVLRPCQDDHGNCTLFGH